MESKLSTAQKKVLILSYYWPPAGGPGVQRWLKFAKYLPEFGYQPTLFVPENPSYPLIDESLEKEVPKDLEIIKTKIWEPYQWAEKLNKSNKKFKAGQFDVGNNQSWKSKLSIWVRGNFFIPDARVFWVKPSVKFLKKYLTTHHFDALVTTGPPHSLHLIGLELKKEFPDLKWIADFRDPWTEISYYQHLKLTRFSDQKHRALEQKVFTHADITLATSYTDAENFKKKGANAICITNGFDADAEQTTNLQNLPQKNHKFTISYIGVLEQLRNPEILWKVLEELISENPDFKGDFALKFVGRIDDKILHNLQQSQIKNLVHNLGYLSHTEALVEMKNSNLLLITNFPQKNSKGIIPGKVFEYLATGNQILSFGPEDADVEQILRTTGAGKHFTYNEKQNVKNFVLEQYNSWKTHATSDTYKDIQNFSRKNLTKKLSEIISNF